MTSIPVAICRFSDNNFKRLYLKKERFFLDLFWYFWNVDEIWNILKKKQKFSSLIITEIFASERHIYLSV